MLARFSLFPDLGWNVDVALGRTSVVRQSMWIRAAFPTIQNEMFAQGSRENVARFQQIRVVCKVVRRRLAIAQIVSRTVRNAFVPESRKHYTSRAQLGRKEGARDRSGSRSAREHWPTGQEFA